MEIKNYTEGKNEVAVVPQNKNEVAVAPEKKVEAVARSKGTRKRNKFVDSVISEEASNVKNYIVDDVLIPSLKKAISDVVTNGIDMILYGETGHTKKSGASKVSYRSYYDYGNSRERTSYRSAGYDFDDLVFETRGEAELVLDNLFEILDRYRVATVADLYDLAGSPGRYTDNKFGWTDLGRAEVVRIRDGYVIKLPRALAID